MFKSDLKSTPLIDCPLWSWFVMMAPLFRSNFKSASSKDYQLWGWPVPVYSFVEKALRLVWKMWVLYINYSLSQVSSDGELFWCIQNITLVINYKFLTFVPYIIDMSLGRRTFNLGACHIFFYISTVFFFEF
jgi:hypothetical protein